MEIDLDAVCGTFGNSSTVRRPARQRGLNVVNDDAPAISHAGALSGLPGACLAMLGTAGGD
jgi:hypothetical protein